MHLAEWGGFCFNCRFQLDGDARVAPGSALARDAAYAFDPVELVRLERYRAAIQCRVYTDWPASTRYASTVDRRTVLHHSSVPIDGNDEGGL